MNYGDHYSTAMFRKLTGNMQFFYKRCGAWLRIP